MWFNYPVTNTRKPLYPSLHIGLCGFVNVKDEFVKIDIAAKNIGLKITGNKTIIAVLFTENISIDRAAERKILRNINEPIKIDTTQQYLSRTNRELK